MIWLFTATLVVRSIDYWLYQPQQVSARQLPNPPTSALLHDLTYGERLVIARMMMLWLQAFDYQPGVSLSFHDLDYRRLAGWLEFLQLLDPKGQYPLLLAATVYGGVSDADKQRRMCDFVEQAFKRVPGERWRWVSHCVVMAQHRIGNEQLALRLARLLSRQPTHLPIPGWARQMEIFLLEQQGHYEAAVLLLGGLLESGVIVDPAEQRFLLDRLEQLSQSED